MSFLHFIKLYIFRSAFNVYSSVSTGLYPLIFFTSFTSISLNLLSNCNSSIADFQFLINLCDRNPYSCFLTAVAIGLSENRIFFIIDFLKVKNVFNFKLGELLRAYKENQRYFLCHQVFLYKAQNRSSKG